MDQIREYNPPPNPAKTTDSRYKAYIAEYGTESWELDALDPTKFSELIAAELEGIRNQSVWEKDEVEKERVKRQLVEISEDWEGIGKNKRLLAKQEGQLTALRSELERANEKLRKRKPRSNGDA